MKTSISGLILVITFLMLTGCGGDDSASNASNTATSPPLPATPPHVLSGQWFGTFNDKHAIIHTMTLVINDEGNVTEALIDGNPTGSTSTLTRQETAEPLPSDVSAYNFNGINAIDGILIVNDANSHMTIVDRDNRVGMLEKGASQLPVFTLEEGDGNFFVVDMFLNDEFSIGTIFTATYIAEEDGTFTGSTSQGDTFAGSTIFFDAKFGWSQNESTNLTQGFALTGTSLTSADKTTLGGYGCQPGYSDFITECFFGITVKIPKPRPHVLSGQWFGAFDNKNKMLHTMTLVINEEGNVTEAFIDGKPTGSTSTLTRQKTAEPIPSDVSAYNFNGINAVDGILIVNGANSHMTIVDRDTRVGMLEKGATELPVFALAEGAGNNKSVDMFLNDDFLIGTIFTATYTVAEDGTYAGSTSQGHDITGSTNFDTEFGRFENETLNINLDFTLKGTSFTSADKSTSGSYGCQPGYTDFITECFFGITVKTD